MRPGLIVLCAFIIVLLGAGIAPAKVDVTVQKTLELGAAPVDAVTSADGQWTFVLVKGGKILVYSAEGELTDTIPVDKSADGVEISKKGDKLFLLSSSKKTMQIVAIDFIREINIAGSPLKGDPKAPVVIAVFSDFQ